jgi:hypothetical protein
LKRVPLDTFHLETGPPTKEANAVNEQIAAVLAANDAGWALPRAAGETEAGFTNAVIALAKWQRWCAYHTHDSRHSAAGWPDLALCRPPRLLVVELKIGRAQPTRAQRRWLALLAAVPGVEVYCWHPADWNEITRVLR